MMSEAGQRVVTRYLVQRKRYVGGEKRKFPENKQFQVVWGSFMASAWSKDKAPGK